MIVVVKHVACLSTYWCICKFVYHETLWCCMHTLLYCEHVTFSQNVFTCCKMKRYC